MGMEKIVRLAAEDYDYAVDFLNLVFSQANDPHDFERMLPKMWKRDDEHMGRHLAVKRDGRILAMLGVYPLPVVIGGKKLIFSTVGNVATHLTERNRGLMARLMDEAMIELDRIEADAARLGGNRQRYNRYGFEHGGSCYNFNITDKNIQNTLGDLSDKYRFVKIERNDEAFMKRSQELFYQQPFFVDRIDIENFYLTMCAWKNKPWAAFDENSNMIGYLVASPDGRNIAEQVADSTEHLMDMLGAWVTKNGVGSIHLKTAPWELSINQQLGRICERYDVSCASMFKIRRWDVIIDALFSLKSQIIPLPDGEVVIGIEDYGNILIGSDHNKTLCTRTNKNADINIDRLNATRLIFGPFPPSAVSVIPRNVAMQLNAWFPLPLSWNGQDRV